MPNFAGTRRALLNRTALSSAPVEAHVMAILGQSENVIGISANASTYTQQTYPALASGVDAAIAIRASNDKSTAATLRTLDAAAITNEDVNPGFVAFANLWHLGSGGIPLRLVDISMAGTDMGAMMDDDDAARDFADDEEIVDLAEAAWGPVTSVTYNWWNSEASITKDLWAQRSVHFFGINSDGSDNDFATLEHCLIDTTERGYGLLTTAAKVNLTLPGIRIVDSENLIDPPYRTYLLDGSGGAVSGMVYQNAIDAVAERKTFRTNTPEAQRGVVTITPAVCRFGDYNGGVKETTGATAIHPAELEPDGQILYAQHLAVSELIAQGYVRGAYVSRVEYESDGSKATFVIDMPPGATLTTIRQQRAETPPVSPRPHQQLDGMGFTLARTADLDANANTQMRNARPIFRTDAGNDTLYPPAYHGTVTIVDSGTDVGGGVREALVEVEPVTPLEDGEVIYFGADGGYGGFILHGYPDYDARLYKDALIAYLPELDDGTALAYPGIPVEPQYIATVSIPDIVAPTLSSPVDTANGTTAATGSVSTNEGNGTLYWVVSTSGTAPSAAQVKAGQMHTGSAAAASGSQAVSGTGVQTLSPAPSGLTASTAYTIHFMHEDAAANQSAVSSGNGFTTDAAIVYATTTSGSPNTHFVDPSNVPASTTVIEYNLRVYVPTSGLTNGTTYYLATQESTGCDLGFTVPGGGGAPTWRVNVEDNDGTNIISGVGNGAIAVNVLLDQWFDVQLIVNAAAGTAELKVNGSSIWSLSGLTFSPASFQSTREIAFLATTSGATPAPVGTRFEYLEAYFTTSGSRTLRKRIAGNAATVNADGWKAGSNAV